MANTFKFGNGNWAVKDGYALAYNDENNNFKPLPFDFTRASLATTLNRQGLIETVGSGKPRIDFLNNTDGHLLLEPSRTNKYPYSNQSVSGGLQTFGTGTRTITVTNNYAISPDGSQNAMRMVATCGSTSSDRAGLRDAISMSSASATLSFYAKSNTSSSQTVSVHFNGSNKQTITLTTEWQRFTYTLTSATTNNAGVEIIGGSTDTSVDVLLFGFQLEQGSYATSYIPTEGSSVTRSAETGIDCLLPNETIINNSTATVYLEFEALVNDLSNRWISFEELGVPTDNMFEIRLSAGSNLLQIVTRSSGGGQDVVMSETLTDITANNKIAVNYNGLNWKLAVNGTIADTETAARLFNDNIEKIKFSRNTNTNHFYGKVKDLRVYNTALTDTELQNLTS